MEHKFVNPLQGKKIIVCAHSLSKKLSMHAVQKHNCTRSRSRLSRHVELYIRIFLVYMTVLYFCALHVKYETQNARRVRNQIHKNHSGEAIFAIQPKQRMAR